MAIKKLVFLAFIVFFISCSEDDNQDQDIICKVNSVHIQTLSFDDFLFPSYDVNTLFSGKLNLVYDTQNRIVNVNGGFVRLPPGQSANDYFLDSSPYDTIVYGTNKVTVKYSVNMSGTYPKQEFTTDSQGRLQSVKSFIELAGTTYEVPFTYEYSENLIVEKSNGAVNRNLYFSNGNLLKVEKFSYGQSGEIFKKEIMDFSNYDQSPNMLKGKFFINGNFLKSFSQNNYRKISYKKFQLYQGEFILNGEGYFELPFSYNPDGNANLFEYDCN